MTIDVQKLRELVSLAISNGKATIPVNPRMLLDIADELDAARACNAQNIAELHRVDALLGEARADVKRAHVAGMREARRFIGDELPRRCREDLDDRIAELERGAP